MSKAAVIVNGHLVATTDDWTIDKAHTGPKEWSLFSAQIHESAEFLSALARADARAQAVALVEDYGYESHGEARIMSHSERAKTASPGNATDLRIVSDSFSIVITGERRVPGSVDRKAEAKEAARPVCLDCAAGVRGSELWLHHEHRGPLCQSCFDRREAKEESRAVDKWGREMRAGDLLSVGLCAPFTILRAVSEWNGPRGTEWTTTVMKPSGKETHWARSDVKRWEVLSRGQPTDPVPESFEPERDREGRPILEESKPQVRVAGGIYNVIRGTWDDAGKFTPEPSLHDRYAAFRATVERVVREVAPGARVVTDFCAGYSGREGRPVYARGQCFVAWIDFGHGIVEELMEIAENQAEKSARLHCSVGRDRLRDVACEIGQRAMGAK